MKQPVFFVLKICFVFALILGATRLSLDMGGGPPSLFWSPNGLLILCMVHTSNIFTMFSILVAGIFGIAIGQIHFLDLTLGLKLGSASSIEILISVFIERNYNILKQEKSFKYMFILIMIFSGINCIVGATAGAFVLTTEFPQSDFITVWVDWFVGDSTGNFIIVYTWYTVSTLNKLNNLDDICKYFSTINIIKLMIVSIFLSTGILVYNVGFSRGIVSILFVFLTAPFIASLGLVFNPVIAALINIILVIFIITGTRERHGPIYNVFSHISQRDVYIGVEITLLITYIMSSFLSIIRNNNINREKQLEKSVKDRINFFCHVSHELRTPLSVITGFVEGILNHSHISQEVRKDLEYVMEASVTMTTTVNDLLIVFRSDGHTLEIENIIVNVNEFFLNIISFVKQLSNKKEIDLNILIDKDIPTNLIFDPRRIRQVMLNIIGNSIKYTSNGGNIDVKVCLYDNNLKVSIKDSGVGIKKDDLSKLFNQFFRCSHTINEQGSGLGLSVCQEIIRSIGGKIYVESVFGEGTTFTFEIPICKSDVESIIEEKHNSPSHTISEIQILVVEDSLVNNILLVRILKRKGYIVDSVMDGDSAIDFIYTKKYDVVLLDLGIPIKSGIEVIREVRANENKEIQSIPIIVTSGSVDNETRDTCTKAGCNAFADKPFREEVINNTILQVLK